MPKASKTTATTHAEAGGFEGDYAELGGYTVGFETYSADVDLGPVFEGLPNNQCQAPHWGYVQSGRVKFVFADHEETYEAGDAYYVPPGHHPVIYTGTEVVEFSPTNELNQTLEVVSRNMEQGITPVPAS
jgi:mannose-6-phosphate isomerase-like protein (cupin superfamily)